MHALAALTVSYMHALRLYITYACPWVALDSCFMILVSSHQYGHKPQSHAMLVLKWLRSDSEVTLFAVQWLIIIYYCFHSKITEWRYWNEVSFSFSEGRLVYSFVDQVFYHMFFTKCQINTATQPLVSNFVTTRRTFKHKWEIVFNYAMKLFNKRKVWHGICGFSSFKFKSLVAIPSVCKLWLFHDVVFLISAVSINKVELRNYLKRKKCLHPQCCYTTWFSIIILLISLTSTEVMALEFTTQTYWLLSYL